MWVVIPRGNCQKCSLAQACNKIGSRCRLRALHALRVSRCGLWGELESRATLPAAALALSDLKQKQIFPGVLKKGRSFGSCGLTEVEKDASTTSAWSECSAGESCEAAARLEALLRVPFVALGLDISTQNTGYAYVSSASQINHLIALGQVSTTRTTGTYAKVAQICDQVSAAAPVAAAHERLQQEDTAGCPFVIGVGAYMRCYTPGRFRTNSLFRLAELNTLIAYEMSRRLGCVHEPLSIHPSEARGWFGLTGRALYSDAASDEHSVKAVVLERVRPWLERSSRPLSPGVAFPDAQAAGHDTRGSVELTSDSIGYDESDAFVIAHYTMVLEQERRALADPALYFAFVSEYGPLILARAKAPEVIADVHLLAKEWRRREQEYAAATGSPGVDPGPLSPTRKRGRLTSKAPLTLPEFSRWIARSRLRRTYGARFMERIEKARRTWIRDTIRMHWGLQSVVSELPT
jgi:hypothetical protein